MTLTAGAKQLVRRFVSVDDRLALKQQALRIRSLRYRGDAVTCPCCDSSFCRFISGGVVRRPNAVCPGCESLERHRLLMLYLRDSTDLFRGPLTLLHIAPEPAIYLVISKLESITYVPAGLGTALARVPVDITNIQFRDGFFDAILCVHVLEHVMDDQTAMREFHRVLKPGGWAMLQVPVDIGRAVTFEDPTIVEPADRLRAFGQDDHVRLYGLDYADRLRDAGFEVTVDNYVGRLDAETIRRYGLTAGERMYRCTKSFGALPAQEASAELRHMPPAGPEGRASPKSAAS